MELKFGERVKELRIEKGMKQSDLAKVFNIKPATLSRWENGIIEPDYKTLIKLAKYFGVSADYLLGLED